ncbi:MAG: HD domain-containing protein [Lachnospiraceae bacterium]|nr:HD domain-containing protein [Lachnospiraceae bacterium]
MNNRSDIRESFRQYAERIATIRRLSSPSIKQDDSAETYCTHLQENFKKIGDLAAINRQMLDRELYPLLNSPETLDSHLVEDLNDLADILLSLAAETDDGDNLDLPISSLIIDRLLVDADRKNDVTNRIRRMDSEATTCYAMINMTSRITSNPSLCKVYTEKGLALGEEFLCMLDKDFFLSIPDVEMRMLVLTNARFMACFFERFCGDEEMNRYNLDILDRMLEIADDEFYHEEVPDFDWRYFVFRCLEYYVMSTEIGNLRGFSRKLLLRIEARSIELEKLLDSDPEYYAEIPGASLCKVHIARCHHLAGSITRREYRDLLLSCYDKRDREDFGMNGIYCNSMIPLELICLLDPKHLTTEDSLLLRRLYQGLSFYLFHSSNAGPITQMLDYYIRVIDRFIDIPSGVSFEDFVLQSLAAAHPPTYVHSRMVGQIAECLSRHLLDTEPERFIGFPGCETVEDVIRNRDEIIHYTYHAGLCHDFGKINIIDTIFVYGRGLLELEFNIIKSHPAMGADLLSRHVGTKRYADVALGHHRWHDNKGGYPEDLDNSGSPYKTVIDLVLCADCLDAATDSVGRSYNKGKTLSDFMDELREGAGTRYAPWLPSLMEKEGVFSDVEYLLTTARAINYRDTYTLLKDVQEKNS